MGNRWGFEGPPDDAYSRVTDPERFLPLITFADALVARLTSFYDVLVADLASDPTGRDDGSWVRGVRLTPRLGAPMTISITSFPGVRCTAGHWYASRAPVCGCDACDEDFDEGRDNLNDFVDVVVNGTFTEELTRHPRRLIRSSTGSRQAKSWSSLSAEQFAARAAVAPPGRYEWPPWPLAASRS